MQFIYCTNNLDKLYLNIGQLYNLFLGRICILLFKLILKRVIIMRMEEEREVQLQVQCRDGPIRERRCTDWFCCLLYLILIGSVIGLALYANTANKTSQQVLDKLLKAKGHNMPFLSTETVLPILLISLGIVTAISIVIVLTTFILPALSAYIFIPLNLLLMLILGAGFLYRFFGNKLPLVSANIQEAYVAKQSVVSFIIGIVFIAGFLISLIVILIKQQRVKFIVASLKLAKICFWDNAYLFGTSIVLSGISIVIFYFNIMFIRFVLIQKKEHVLVPKWPVVYLILFQMVWTHGFMQALSDFLCQSVSLHWYYNSKRHHDEQYSGFTSNFLPSLRLMVIHSGTIVFGSILTYFPDFVNGILNSCEEKAQGCYRIFCCCHKLMCESLSKYCYLGTIMYGYPFCRASSSIRTMRVTAKHTFPELYMIGSFYLTLMKIFIILLSLITTYFLIVYSNRFTGSMNLIGPLLGTLMVGQQVANHFMNTTGLIGDSIYLTYVIDFNCETTNFGNLNADHCPKQAYDVINEAKIGRYAIYD